MTDPLLSESAPLALVTGASSGIGLELAREFVAHGHDVVVAAEDDGIRRVPELLAVDGPETVTAIQVDLALPGPTDTNFFARAGMEDTKLGQGEKDDPRDVARDGYEALKRDDDHVVAGSMKNEAQAMAGKLMPYERTAKVHGAMSEPGSGERE